MKKATTTMSATVELIAQKTGWLSCEGALRTWKRRFAVCATQQEKPPQLLLYKRQEDWATAAAAAVAPQPEARLVIDSPRCVRLLLDSKAKKKNAFVVNSMASNQTCVLAADTPKERKEWLDLLQAPTPAPVANPVVATGGGVGTGAAGAAPVGVVDFDLMKSIGRGTFGRVYQVQFRRTGEIFAMKILDKRQIVEHGEVRHTLSELHVLKSLRHPFLINLHYSFQTEDQLFFVLDFINGGELFAHLQRARSFPLERARFYAAEICLAIACLHDNGVAYRDLKPENLLLTDEGHIKVTDFGLAKEGMHAQDDKTATFCGSKEYLAPEVLLGNGYGKNVDWWSFGSLLFEMLVGLPPFFSEDVQVMYHRIISDELVFPPDIPVDAQDLISQFLDRDPERRLCDIEVIKAHPFWNGLDWDLLYQKKIAPPYVPVVHGKADTGQIDLMFTSEEPSLHANNGVPPGPPLQPADQQEFANFTYVAGAPK